MSLRDLIHQQWLAQQKASQASDQPSDQQGQSKPTPKKPKEEDELKDGGKK